MKPRFKTYTFDECYLPVRFRILIDEEKDLIQTGTTDLNFERPKTDGSILDAVLYVYDHMVRVLSIREVAEYVHVDARELSSAIHMLTGMKHDVFFRQYRLRSICEVLRTTRISTTAIAHYFGYASLRSMNHFLDLQIGLTANEIREGRDPKSKVKRPAWWKK